MAIHTYYLSTSQVQVEMKNKESQIPILFTGKVNCSKKEKAPQIPPPKTPLNIQLMDQPENFSR